MKIINNIVFTSFTFIQPVVFLLPVFVILVIFSINKDKIDLYEALMSVTLALGLNGVVTDTIKLIVGKNIRQKATLNVLKDN